MYSFILSFWYDLFYTYFFISFAICWLFFLLLLLVLVSPCLRLLFISFVILYQFRLFIPALIKFPVEHSFYGLFIPSNFHLSIRFILSFLISLLCLDSIITICSARNCDTLFTASLFLLSKSHVRVCRHTKLCFEIQCLIIFIHYWLICYYCFIILI